MIVRSFRARTGDAPAVEIAICTGARSTSDGMMKLESAALSATFTGTRSARAAFATASFALGSSVAAMTTSAPTRSPGWMRFASWRIAPSNVSSARRAQSSGAITVTRTPERSNVSALFAATGPPPTTIPGLPRRSRNAAR